MSGGYYPFPKYVWSPSGGWWFTPKNYKTNAVILGSALVGSSAIAYFVSKNSQHDPQLEHSDEVIKKWNNAVKK